MPRYIEANALNAAIEEWFDGVCAYDVSPSEAVNDFQSIVDEQPTVSPDEARGVGEWLHTSDEFGEYEKCSCCGKEYYCGPIAPFNYCPNCGAKMEVSDDA